MNTANKKTEIVHLKIFKDGPVLERLRFAAHCGGAAGSGIVAVTSDPSAVTCRRCIRVLNKRIKAGL